MIRSLKIPAVLVSGILLILLFLIQNDIISQITFNSYLYASIITIVNFAAFIFFIDFSFKKSTQIFLIVNLGGMGIRVLFMLILVFLTIKFLKIDEFKFIFAFFLLYVLFLVYEIVLIKRKLKELGKAPINSENVV